MNLPNFQFFFNNKSETLDVVLHGGSKGMDSGFIRKIVIASKRAGNSVVAFDFPYLSRGEGHSSGPKLKEEQEVLKAILKFCQADSFKHIRLISKSLGGIVASYFLKSLSQEECKKFSIIILGYILGDVDLKTFSGRITVIQGGKDRFGDIETVKQNLKNAISQDIKYHQIDGADHSYRNPETKDSDYENKVVKLIFEH